jgi:tryptophan synthase
LKDSGRAEYVVATDEEALRGFRMLTQLEGIIPALESSHAIWEGARLASTLPADQDIVIVRVVFTGVTSGFLTNLTVSLWAW